MLPKKLKVSEFLLLPKLIPAKKNKKEKSHFQCSFLSFKFII
jgi:hypothetical protein